MSWSAGLKLMGAQRNSPRVNYMELWNISEDLLREALDWPHP
jgi:hypothetical protein